MFKGEEIGLKDKNGKMIKCGDILHEYWVADDEENNIIDTKVKVVYVPQKAAFGFEESYKRNGKIKKDVIFLVDLDYQPQDYEIIK